jgi:arylsulfatase
LNGDELRFAHDFFGIAAVHDLVCEAPGPGRHVVGVEIARKDLGDADGPPGRATLYVDGVPIVCAPLRTMNGRFLLCGEGLTIGCDGADASSSEHDASSSLVGARVIKVVFDVAEEAAVDAEGGVRRRHEQSSHCATDAQHDEPRNVVARR